MQLGQALLNSVDELDAGVGFIQPAERVGFAGLLALHELDVAGREDATNAELAIDLFSRLESVDVARKPDIHQDEIRATFPCKSYGFFGARRETDAFVAGAAQIHLRINGDENLVFDDQDLVHGSRDAFGST